MLLVFEENTKVSPDFDYSSWICKKQSWGVASAYLTDIFWQQAFWNDCADRYYLFIVGVYKSMFLKLLYSTKYIFT